MAAPKFKVEIITPDETVFDGEAVSLVAPGANGYLGILVDHAPLVTPLIEGRIDIRISSQLNKSFAVKSGFLEVKKNRVLILSETAREVSPPVPVAH